MEGSISECRGIVKLSEEIAHVSAGLAKRFTALDAKSAKGIKGEKKKLSRAGFFPTTFRRERIPPYGSLSAIFRWERIPPYRSLSLNRI
jgi:hypothetical protein